jgi:hypothetical protein
LVMTIDFSMSGKVKFYMIDYVQSLLDKLPTDMDGTVPTPASAHLFDVSNSWEKLLDELGNFFHHNTAKLLCLCKHARPDIQTATAFLCTQVKSPDTDDYKRLGHVMKYLRETLHMQLRLKANDMHIMKWSVDASFAVHPDMRRRTGGSLTMRRGTVFGTSTQRKIDRKVQPRQS